MAQNEYDDQEQQSPEALASGCQTPSIYRCSAGSARDKRPARAPRREGTRSEVETSRFDPCPGLSSDATSASTDHEADHEAFRATVHRPGFRLVEPSPLTDSNRRPPPYHGTSQATGGNPWQRFSLVFAVTGARHLSPFATGCNHGAP